MPAEITASDAKVGLVLDHFRCTIRSLFTLTVATLVLCVWSMVPGVAAANSAHIDAFYELREQQPAWLDAKRLMELAQLRILAELHGLDPADYALADIERTANAAFTGAEKIDLARFDRQATASIAHLASDLPLWQTRINRTRTRCSECFGRSSSKNVEPAASGRAI